jgi:hypothetical protein
MGTTRSTAARSGRGKWIFLGAMAVAAVIAVESGWAGFGWAQLRASVFPRDEALLGWVPGDTSAVAILDPHQLDLKALGGEGSTARTALERTRDDVKKASGIDLAFDVDKLVLSPSLVVARGRFDRAKLEQRLSEHRYARAEHKGEVYLVRAGEDAIAVIDGAILLYGDEAGIKGAIDAHQGGTSIEKNEPMMARLKQVGWDHPLLVTVRITDDKPSLREILTGSTGPRGVTVGARTLTGLNLDVLVDAASPSAGEETRKLLEEKRAHAAGLVPLAGAEVNAILVEVAKKAGITADPQTGSVKMHVHLDAAQLETLAKNARAAAPMVAEYYKTLRLAQLLMPGL